MMASSPLVEKALERLGRHDVPGSLDAFNQWLDALCAGSTTVAAGTEILFDTICRVDQAIREMSPWAGISDDRRSRVLKDLHVCISREECMEVFQSALRELLGSMSRRTRPSRAVHLAREYILANFRRRLPIHEIAGAAGVTPNYLSHLFRKECGTTLVQFVNRLRIDEAARLLREEETPISEIADLVGYRNYRDFHRNFVRFERLAPRSYRRGIPRRPMPPASGSATRS